MGRRLQIRVSDADYAEWSAEAASLRLSLSAYVRARVIMAKKQAQRATETKPERPRLVCDVCSKEGRITGCPRCANLNA